MKFENENEYVHQLTNGALIEPKGLKRKGGDVDTKKFRMSREVKFFAIQKFTILRKDDAETATFQNF